jgi:hypothetical protein
MEQDDNLKAIVAVLIAAMSVAIVLLTSLTFSLTLVENLVLSWITTTAFSIFLFFLFDRDIIAPLRIVEKPVYIEKEVIKFVDNPIQIPIENKTIEVVDRPTIVYRDIVRPLVQRMTSKRKLNIPKYRYLGSINTRRYHKKTCRLSKLIKKKFKIQSNSQKFFINKHYKACKSCLKN